MNQIIYNGKTYQDPKGIDSLDGFIGDSLPADELTVDTLTPVVVDKSANTLPLSASGLLLADADGTLMAAKLTEPLDNLKNREE